MIESLFTAILSALLTFAPQCASEDSTYCYWDASTQGNGQGSSLINFGEGHYIAR